MVKARTWFTLFIVSLGTVAATASCGSSDEATGGAAGGTVLPGGGRAGGTGRAGAGGGGGAPSVSGSTLGIECTSDTQCGDGMLCATANGTAFGKGGPSKGMCTMACVSGGTECGALSPGAECIKFTTGSYCLEACEQGTPVADLSTKCGGRSDFVCADLGPSGTIAPFCVPNCRSNEECGPGLYCDKSDLPGLCTKTKPPSGDPVGASCNPNSTTNTCEGICIRTSADNVTPVTGECVEFCSGGFECMYGAGPNPTPGGFCAGKLSTTFGAIDVGFCLPNCSCSSDCQFEGFLCRKWPDNQSDLAMAVGAPGMCYPVVAQSVELSCGEGGAGGAGGASGAGGSGGDSAGGSGGDSSVPPASAGAAGSGI